MALETSENLVALYWDFENIHAGVLDEIYGYSRYKECWYMKQEPVLSIRAIMDYAATLGVVTINRAYANWHNFYPYRDELNLNGLDLIQHFPRGSKNGADIRLALDVVEDLHRFSHLTHIIVVGSDSDYISLAQKVKQLGRRIVGIGVQPFTNPFWVQSCNEFKYYRALVEKTDPAAAPPAAADDTAEPANLDDAKELLLKSMRQLVAQRGENVVPRSSLKPLMLRFDPTFDEASLGFGSFSAFLNSFPDLIQNVSNSSGGQVALRTAGGDALDALPDAPPELAADRNYVMILRKGGFRQLPSPWWRDALGLTEEIFQEAGDQSVPSFDALRQTLAQRLHDRGLGDDPLLINKLRVNMFALHLFHLDRTAGVIRLNTGQHQDAESLLTRYELAVVKRLVQFAAPPIDARSVASLIYGETTDQAVADAGRLVERVVGSGAPDAADGPAEEPSATPD